MKNILETHRWHFVGAVFGGSAGWFFPAFALACVVAYIGFRVMSTLVQRSSSRRPATVPHEVATHPLMAQTVGSIGGMLVVPVRPATQHRHASAA
jgi:hypothetical protein